MRTVARIKGSPVPTPQEIEAMTKSEMLKRAKAMASQTLPENAIPYLGYATRLKDFFDAYRKEITKKAEQYAYTHAEKVTKNHVTSMALSPLEVGKMKVTASFKPVYDDAAMQHFIEQNADEEYVEIQGRINQVREKLDALKADLKAFEATLAAKEAQIIAEAPADVRQPIGEKVSFRVIDNKSK